MSTLVLQIEDENIVTQIKEFISHFKTVKMQELTNDACDFNESEFVESLQQIKSGEALKNAKPISELFEKMETQW
jgi:hypothetical protein